ncbi:NAD-dependent epimerase/dehydratase [Candidatus Saccharibacteria bacterium RAAC3_TM7_1]|nr:NAD-dependent epimerase/dehydratase [Candidatus Saccharibacteria bacterium RAAC3_TM7_1]
MNIVITGVSGFVGKHLVRELSAAGHAVIGIGMEEVAHPEIADLLTEYVSCDLAEAWPKIATPVDSIIHLAGLAAVGPSFEKPQAYINLNSAMVTNMAEAYLHEEKKPRLVIISSGAIYDSNQPMPLTEASTISFSSPYTVSKVLLENQAAYYRTQGLECIIMRPFNHIGPGQLPGFLVPDLIEKICTAENTSSLIKVGDLSTKRDYTDVRDVVKAYALVATAPETPHEVYNVCSGKSLSGEEVLITIQKAMDAEQVATETDPSLIRPNDAADIRGDNSRLTADFNWRPVISFRQTIQDILKEDK